MSNGWSRLILILSLLLALTAAWVWAFRRPTDPVVEGRRLSSWIYLLRTPSAESERAETVISRVGAGALPRILVELQRSNDSPVILKTLEMYRGSEWARRNSPFQISYRLAPERRQAAAEALGLIADQVGLPTLSALLQDAHPEIRTGASHAMATGLKFEGVQALMEALKSPREEVRIAALSGLGRTGYIPQDIAPLLHCLKASNPDERWAAAVVVSKFSRAYRELPIPGLVEALVGAFQDPSIALRAMMARALGALGTVAMPAIPALEQLAKDSDPQLQLAADAALRQIRQASASRARPPLDRKE